ncbi:hypothetical protein [Methanobacterium sp. ACI-7]|uniref:hypothetical protein n=1 Tax=unclassified Methanobacterium TaxID=2627676 RepID=UPI0039C1A525
MSGYEDEEFWFMFLKFALLLNKDPYFKPKKANEIKKSFKYIHNIKEASNNIKDHNKYSEIILMANEVENNLKTELKQKIS